MRLKFAIRNLLWLARCLVVILMGVRFASAQSTAEAKPKEQLTDYAQTVIVRGDHQQLPKELAQYFGLPTESDDLNFSTLNAQRVDGTHAGTFVKHRTSGRIDIFFAVNTSFNGSYYYLTSADGKLIKAVHFNFGPDGVSPIANDDAQKAFEHEKSFWLERPMNASAVFPFVPGTVTNR